MKSPVLLLLSLAALALASGLDTRGPASTALAAATSDISGPATPAGAAPSAPDAPATGGGAPAAPTPNPDHGLSDWEQIHQTLHRYSLAIDFKNAALFSRIFTRDAFANYTGPLSNMTGLSDITAKLLHAVSLVDSQHQLGTTVIDTPTGWGLGWGVGNASEAAGGGIANATTYFSATLFGKGNLTGQRLMMYGYYADGLVKVPGDGWRIRERYLRFMGPSVGDMDLVPSGSQIGN